MNGFWAAEPAARLMGFGRTAVPGPRGQTALEGAQGSDWSEVPREFSRHRQHLPDTHRGQAKMGCEKLCRVDVGNAGLRGRIHRIKLVNPAALASAQCKGRRGDGSRRPDAEIVG